MRHQPAAARPHRQGERADLETLARLAGSGAITPVIGRTYPLADAAQAIRNIADGHATGKGIIVS